MAARYLVTLVILDSHDQGSELFSGNWVFGDGALQSTSGTSRLLSGSSVWDQQVVGSIEEFVATELDFFPAPFRPVRGELVAGLWIDVRDDAIELLMGSTSLELYTWREEEWQQNESWFGHDVVIRQGFSSRPPTKGTMFAAATRRWRTGAHS